MRIWLLLGFVATASCSAFVKANPEYCEDSSQCKTGSFCDLQLHHCVSPAGALEVTAVEPPAGASRGGTPITIRGRNFQQGMTVAINNLPTAEVLVSADGTSATTTAPFSSGACGPASVKVTNPDGAQVESATLFRYKMGTLAFAGSSVRPVDPSALSIAAADTSGLGWSNLLILGAPPQVLRVLQVDASGSAIGATDFASSTTYSQIMVANLDNNQFPDLLAVGSGQVTPWAGNATSQFTELTAIPRSLKAVRAADFTLDGLADLVFADGVSLSIYRNTSAAGAVSFAPLTGGQISGLGNLLAAEQLDEDMLGDIAVCSAQGQLVIRFGDSSLNFSATVALPTGLTSPSYLTAVDVDLDGRRDLLLVDATSQLMSVVRNLGSRRFAALPPVRLSATPDLVQVADLDCDGWPEVIYAQRNTAIFNVQPNLGVAPYFDGTQKITISAPDVIAQFVAARLGQDGLTDLGMLKQPGTQNLALAYVLRNSSQ